MGNKPVMRMVAQKALKVFIMSFTLIVHISSLLHTSYPILNLLLQVLTFFATNECKWSNDNVLKLKEELTAVDKKTFNFDLSTLNLADFMDDYVKVFLFGVFHLFRLFFCVKEQDSMFSKRILVQWNRQDVTPTRCSGLKNVFR